MARKSVKIVQPLPPADEVPTEVLATAITEVSRSAKALLDGPLKKRAILVLIRDSAVPAIPLSTIEAVLDAAAGLEARFVK